MSHRQSTIAGKELTTMFGILGVPSGFPGGGAAGGSSGFTGSGGSFGGPAGATRSPSALLASPNLKTSNPPRGFIDLGRLVVSRELKAGRGPRKGNK